MYTVISLFPSKTPGDNCNLVTIYSICENSAQAQLDMDQAYVEFMKSKQCGKTKQALLEQDDTQWKRLNDGQIFGTKSTASTVVPNNNDATSITVWEKFSTPGLVYGCTKKRKLVCEFRMVHFDGTVTKSKLGHHGSSTKVSLDQKTVSYGHVLDELKTRLVNGPPPKKRFRPTVVSPPPPPPTTTVESGLTEWINQEWGNSNQAWDFNPLWQPNVPHGVNNDDEDLNRWFNLHTGKVQFPAAEQLDTTKSIEAYQTAVSNWKQQSRIL